MSIKIEHVRKKHIFGEIQGTTSFANNHIMSIQGSRTWQPFVGSKNGNENFRQTHIYNFRVKCVVFARNRKFAKLTQ